ncbi:hypothetical protein ABZS86_05875 [Streptomyces sp. NPDC005355]
MIVALIIACEVGSLRDRRSRTLFVIGVSVVIALSYTLWPKRERAGSTER